MYTEPFSTIDIAFGCHQKYKVSSYYWRHHVLQKQGPRDPELELTWMLLPWELAFMIKEDLMQAPKAERQPIILPSYNVYKSHQWPAWHKNSKDTVEASIH